MTTTELRETDSKGRETLPKGFSNATILIEIVNDVELVIRKAIVAPFSPSGEPRFFEEEILVLSDEDRDAFLAVLDNPSEPNEALKKLMRGAKKPAGENRFGWVAGALRFGFAAILHSAL